MILAANGYAEQFGFYPKRFMHLMAHASLSRPLTDAERNTYGAPEPWGMTPANAFAGITMLYTNDHRIVIRQGLEYCPSQTVTPAQQADIKRRHKKLFDARFPMLPDVVMAHTWSGTVCLSRNTAPGFGQPRSNVWSAVCQNAVGVTKGTFGGILAADMATERDNPLIEDMQSLGEPRPLPPRPFLDIGVRARRPRSRRATAMSPAASSRQHPIPPKSSHDRCADPKAYGDDVPGPRRLAQPTHDGQRSGDRAVSHPRC